MLPIFSKLKALIVLPIILVAAVAAAYFSLSTPSFGTLTPSVSTRFQIAALTSDVPMNPFAPVCIVSPCPNSSVMLTLSIVRPSPPASCVGSAACNAYSDTIIYAGQPFTVHGLASIETVNGTEGRDLCQTSPDHIQWAVGGHYDPDNLWVGGYDFGSGCSTQLTVPNAGPNVINMWTLNAFGSDMAYDNRGNPIYASVNVNVLPGRTECCRLPAPRVTINDLRGMVFSASRETGSADSVVHFSETVTGATPYLIGYALRGIMQPLPESGTSNQPFQGLASEETGLTGTYQLCIGFQGPVTFETHCGQVQLENGGFVSPSTFSGTVTSPQGFEGPQTSVATAKYTLDSSGKAEGNYVCGPPADGQTGAWLTIIQNASRKTAKS